MAVFIKIDGVQGESQKEGFEGAIEANDFQINMMAPRAPEGSGHSGGQVSVGDATFTGMEGRHTIEFWKKITKGTHFDNVTVEMTKMTGDGTPQVWKRYLLGSVYVTHIGSSDNSDGPSSALVSMAYDTIKIEYFAQDKTGKLSNVGSTEYDARKAKTA